ncbi:hypothetical protein DID88_006091 [Monilinia fructigena]|uniref:GED domain-containing protein n=1 Tax=Monilinia fructigena TaxID=38457 RepID=A0A395J1Q3_9HELO|nr:hypothetical protein DID88_006091 [Monilinia fructigena]
MDTEFCNNFRNNGHKYQIVMSDTSPIEATTFYSALQNAASSASGPIHMSKSTAIHWIRQIMVKNRGQNLQGNFNPVIIGELFREQSSNWEGLVINHVEGVTRDLAISDFGCPEGSAQGSLSRAGTHLWRIHKDTRSITTITTRIQSISADKSARRLSLQIRLESATEHNHLSGCNSTHTSASIDVDKVATTFLTYINPDMDNFSSGEALECLFAIYKVCQKTFIAIITTQVIERYIIIRSLEDIFSPITVNSLSDAEVEAMVSEPTSAGRQREFLEDPISKLEEGYEIFRGVMDSATH